MAYSTILITFWLANMFPAPLSLFGLRSFRHWFFSALRNCRFQPDLEVCLFFRKKQEDVPCQLTGNFASTATLVFGGVPGQTPEGLA